MKAYVLHGINDIRYEEVEKPTAGDNEVIVAVKACGICGSDIPRIYQTGAHVHPLIPGHEFAGKVIELGSGVDRKWLDKPVGVFPLIPCGRCVPCQRKQYEMCRNYNYLGSRCDGGFAEYVAVPEANLIELQKGVTYEQAAMLEPMAVAVHCMRRLSPKKEDKVFVYGLGTIGLLLVMFLKESGIENLYVIGNKEFQKKNIIMIGIDENNYCDSKITDVAGWIMEKTDGIGADCIFECIGKNETVSKCIECAAPAGKVMLVGNPYSDMTFVKDIYWKILRNQLTVTGTWNSSFTHEETDDWHYVVDKLAAGKVKPEELISHRFELDEIECGMEIMRDKSEDYVKVMGVNYDEDTKEHSCVIGRFVK